MEEDEKLNEIAVNLIEALSKIEDFDDKLLLAENLYINIICQVKIGCLINPKQTSYVLYKLKKSLAYLINKTEEVLKLSENELLKYINNNRIKNPKFADVFDSALSEYRKLKEKFNHPL